MELLTYPHSEYLLEASIDTLHAESIEWLNEIEFWGDEIGFFYKLLHRQKTKNRFPSEEMADAEMALIKLNTDKLDKLRLGVISHERLLSSFMKSNSMPEEQVYRETHVKLLSDMHDFEKEIRVFKRNIFLLAEKL